MVALSPYSLSYLVIIIHGDCLLGTGKDCSIDNLPLNSKVASNLNSFINTVTSDYTLHYLVTFKLVTDDKSWLLFSQQ